MGIRYEFHQFEPIFNSFPLFGFLAEFPKLNLVLILWLSFVGIGRGGVGSEGLEVFFWVLFGEDQLYDQDVMLHEG